MEKHKQQHHGKDHHPGTWVLITSGSARVFGRVNTLKKFGAEALMVDNETSVDSVLEADFVSLSPCLDFFAPLRPGVKRDEQGRPVMGGDGNPVMTMSRDPVITTRDFTLKPYPVHVRLGPGVMFDFLAQMHENDQATYLAFITAAIGHAREESVTGSGLVLPSGDQTAAINRQHGKH